MIDNTLLIENLAKTEDPYFREKVEGVEPAEWYQEDMIARLRGDRSAWPNVGIVNYDSQRRGAQTPIEHDLEILAAFARRRMEMHGEFLLIVNATSAHDGVPKARTHLNDVLCRLFEGLPLTTDAFHVYTSEGYKQPMVHLQIRMGF